jgi:hypothetical protein
MAAIKERKKSFLSDAAWKVLPWSNLKKPPKEFLLDILADVPSLFEVMETIAHCEERSHKAKYHDHLAKEYLRIEENLAQWHKKFKQLLVPLDQMIPISGVVTPQILGTVHISTIYWAICIIIYGIVRKILIQKKEVLDRREIDPSILCRNILKNIPIFLSPETGIFRVHLVTFPLSVATMYLALLPPKTMTRERALLEECLHNPACSTIRKLLASMQIESYRVYLEKKSD